MKKLEWILYACYTLEFTDGEHEYRTVRVLEIIDGKELSEEQAQDLLFKEEISNQFGEGESRVEIDGNLKRVWDNTDDSRVVEITDFRIISLNEYRILVKYLPSDKIGNLFNPSIRKEKEKKE